MKLPETRAAVPASLLLELPVPEKPFSSSSTQRIEGATASAIWIARRMFSSELPTIPAKILPTSSRRSGSRQAAPTALAVSDFPPPGIPIIRIPFGLGGQPQRRLYHVLPLLPGRNLRSGVPGDAVEDGVDLEQLRQRVLDHRHFLVELRRNGEQRRDEEDGLQLLLELAPDVAQQPHHLGILEIRVQVAEDEEGALVGFRLHHEPQGLQRILRVSLRLLAQA